LAKKTRGQKSRGTVPLNQLETISIINNQQEKIALAVVFLKSWPVTIYQKNYTTVHALYIYGDHYEQ
jgi:hypothetical protein